MFNIDSNVTAKDKAGANMLKDPTRFGKERTHCIATAVLGIDFCTMSHQQVNDFSVALPGSTHQRGHLRSVW